MPMVASKLLRIKPVSARFISTAGEPDQVLLKGVDNIFWSEDEPQKKQGRWDVLQFVDYWESAVNHDRYQALLRFDHKSEDVVTRLALKNIQVSPKQNNLIFDIVLNEKHLKGPAIRALKDKNYKIKEFYLDASWRNRPVTLIGSGEESRPVSGISKQGASVFHSIPFAQQPTGDMRWRAPEEIKTHSLREPTFDASSFAPVKNGCLQLVNGDRGKVVGREDCLNLSVYVGANLSSFPAGHNPSDQSERVSEGMPVLVNLYGGSLNSGQDSPMDLTFIQNKIIRGSGTWASFARGPRSINQPFVVVSPNYRVGAMGFYARDGADGNFGFQDQIQALRWVKKNIAKFNGDPDKVTLIGQSSGGSSALSLLASPTSAKEDLFSSVISMSGSPNMAASSRTVRNDQQYLADNLGCYQSSPKQRMKCLRAKSGSEILENIKPGTFGGPYKKRSWSKPLGRFFDKYWGGGPWGMSLPISSPFSEAIDSGHHSDFQYFTPLSQTYREGPSARLSPDVPLMISNMAQENGNNSTGKKSYFDYSVADFNRLLIETFGDDAGEDIINYYSDLIRDDRQKAYDSIYTDLVMSCGNLQLAKSAGFGFSSPVYSILNTFTDGISENLKPKGKVENYSHHGLDLLFAVGGGGQLNQDKESVGERLRRYWYEFADTGRVKEFQAVNDNDSSLPILSNSSMIWQNEINNDGVMPSYGLKGTVCDMFASYGLNDPSLWWIN